MVIGASLLGPEGFLLRLARLFRLVRLAKLGRFTAAWQTLARAIANRGFEPGMSMAMALLLILLTSSRLYLISARIRRDAWQEISFNALDQIEPEQALALFDLRWKHSRSAELGEIEPH